MVKLNINEFQVLPSSLVTCLLDNGEVGIVGIAPKKIKIRVVEKIHSIEEMKIAFYVFNEYKYREIIIKKFEIDEVKKKQYSLEYTFNISDENYTYEVNNIFKDYSRYLMLKVYGEDNDFSKEMVGYPSELDYDFSEDYLSEKKKWIENLNYVEGSKSILDSVELAVKLDNYILYKEYLNNSIKDFKKHYFKKNFMENHILSCKEISRLYIGNEFCHNLFPTLELLLAMMDKAREEGLEITISFTYMREYLIDNTRETLKEIYNWCEKMDTRVEIIINDWGMLELLKDKSKYFKISLGILLNKRRKDPRYIYKKGYGEDIEIIRKNNLNSNIFSEFLKKNLIERYEYESCGYKVDIAKGNHSLQMPFYQTNTSQYCTLYAMCTKIDRGKQKLVKNCARYCEKYCFIYPKHLKMIGMYNSLFAFYEGILKDFNELEYYIDKGIDRIVLNFI